MTDAGPHPPFLLPEFPSTLARFLDAHAVLHVPTAAMRRPFRSRPL